MKDPVSVKTVETRVEAEIIQGLLEANNIKGFISGDDEGGMSPYPFQISSTGIQVFVDKKDYERAMKLLQEKEKK